MRYIENDGHVTCEYEVVINTEELMTVIKELDEKCCRLVNEKIKIAAYSKEEAVKKINIAINSAGIKINELIEISDGYKDLVNYPGSPFVFDCVCLTKKSPHLVNILQRLLDNYESSVEFKRENNWLIDYLIQYENSDELKPYEVREDKTNNLLLEMENNKDFDFALLAKLYQQAKDCFRLQLISETVHYKDTDKDFKVYKLGTRKSV